MGIDANRAIVLTFVTRRGDGGRRRRALRLAFRQVTSPWVHSRASRPSPRRSSAASATSRAPARRPVPRPHRVDRADALPRRVRCPVDEPAQGRDRVHDARPGPGLPPVGPPWRARHEEPSVSAAERASRSRPWPAQPHPARDVAAPGTGRWPAVVRVGLIGAVVAIYLCLVGIVPIFAERPLISGGISLGQTALLIDRCSAPATSPRGRSPPRSRLRAIVAGAFAGAIAMGSLSTASSSLGAVIDIRGGLPQCLARPVATPDQRHRHVLGLVPGRRRRDHRAPSRRHRHLAAERGARPAHLGPRDAGVLRPVRRAAADAAARLPAVAELARFLFASEGLTPDRRALDRSSSAISFGHRHAPVPGRRTAATVDALPTAQRRHGRPLAGPPGRARPAPPAGPRVVLRPGHRHRRAVSCCWASASTSRSAWPASSTSASSRSSRSAPTRSPC